MRMVSLDSEAKREHFLRLTASESLQYFWTGGRLSADKVRDYQSSSFIRHYISLYVLIIASPRT